MLLILMMTVQYVVNINARGKKSAKSSQRHGFNTGRNGESLRLNCSVKARTEIGARKRKHGVINVMTSLC